MPQKIIKKFVPRIIGFKLNTQFKLNKDKALNKAYQLFSTPRNSDIKPHQNQFLEAAKAKKHSINSYQIQTYHWPGKGETVLLVHGWDSNTSRWKSLVKELTSSNFNIIAFDAPAHGNSTGTLLNVPLYAEVLEELISIHKPNHLIGHSIGAMTLIFNQFKFNNSKDIKKLVLLGAPSEMKLIMRDYQKILQLSPKFMSELNTYFKQKFGYYFEAFSIAEFAKSVHVPSLIIHDQYDKIAPVEAAKSIHKNLKNSQLIITEGAGHSLKNNDIDKNILKFIQS
ncbi:Pimeloyl-ACP methyl ester carboxylesterase [Psychroflexus salarius]|uniref:Pimeloyl-ACP methyl ester carboxylesterase n=1 Tax=Psychroflexus salarius TaxID=1155689 RepID=A0A1M4U1M3_9FLAO|nr:alpha/beta hydrolase [Psychroflexus salarius]SHE50517.1 Pimeloyl-ACP methyl ester carboxylesterase [Psychroflexus salarius]